MKLIFMNWNRNFQQYQIFQEKDGYLRISTSSPMDISLPRLPAHAWPSLGQHVRLHSSVHSDGRAPGPERGSRRRRVLQSPSPALHCRGDPGHHITWDHKLHWGADRRYLQHFRGEKNQQQMHLSGVCLSLPFLMCTFPPTTSAVKHNYLQEL